ncbi:MAG: sulfite exporter TauE/SafE family protein [Magnetococcus sp. DMHC-6]
MISFLFIASLITGLLAGILAGLLGVGGGILIVPALLMLFHLDGINPVIAMQLATGTSLATIVVTNCSAIWNHHKRHAVDWKIVPQYIPGVILGAWLGAQGAALISGELLRTLFGLFEIAIGLQMVRSHSPNPPSHFSVPEYLHPVLGIGIGMLSSLFGIGGGTLSVPVLNLIVGLPILQAVGSASAIGLAIAVAGASGYIHAGWGLTTLPHDALGFVVPTAFYGIICGTLLTTHLGVRLAHTLPANQLKRGFGLFLLLVGFKLLWH